jgi:hypothetical protein
LGQSLLIVLRGGTFRKRLEGFEASEMLLESFKASWNNKESFWSALSKFQSFSVHLASFPSAPDKFPIKLNRSSIHDNLHLQISPLSIFNFHAQNSSTQIKTSLPAFDFIFQLFPSTNKLKKIPFHPISAEDSCCVTSIPFKTTWAARDAVTWSGVAGDARQMCCFSVLPSLQFIIIRTFSHATIESMPRFFWEFLARFNSSDSVCTMKISELS